MARVAVAVTALAVACSTFATPSSAELLGDGCAGAIPVAGTIAGVVSKQNPEDWWWQVGAPGRYIVSLTAAPGEAALTVTDSACGSLCGGVPILPGVSECLATTADLGIRIGVSYVSGRLPVAYEVTITPIGPGTAACSDWIDNDGDGYRDSADAGCAGLLDDSEDDGGACPQYAAGPACATLAIGGEFKKLSLTPHRTQEVAAYLDVYEFRAGGVRVEVPCVSVLLEPWNYSVDPCDFPRSTRLSRTSLYATAYPHTPLDDPTICFADLTLVVGTVTDTRSILAPCSPLPVD